MTDEANPTIVMAIVGGVGACAGAVATIVVGWFRLRSNDRTADNVAHQALLDAQQKMIDQQARQIATSQDQVTEAVTQLSRQREFYDKKLDELYKQINDMKRRCQAPDGCWRRAED